MSSHLRYTTLAVQLVHDAHLHRFEQAIIVSGDSDLRMPLELAIKEINVPVGVLNPQKHPCVALQQHAKFYRHIRRSALAASQFPEMLADSQGTFHKPLSW